MPKVIGLRCRECGAEYELQATHVCEMCFGPLDAVYDVELLKKTISRSRIENGPKSMWRYRDLLPVEDSVAVVTLGEGFTPLVRAERLGWKLPDEIIIPIASGCQFVRHRQAARELIEFGLVRGDRVPAFTGAQALGCAPVYNAFVSDTPERVLPVKPDTIARSIAIGNPSDGMYVNRIARETGGVVEAVTEQEIVDAMRLLAPTEGIVTEA